MQRLFLATLPLVAVISLHIVACRVARHAATKPIGELNMGERASVFFADSFADVVEELQNAPRAIREGWIFRNTQAKRLALRKALARKAEAADRYNGHRGYDSPEQLGRFLMRYGSNLRRLPTDVIDFVRTIHPSDRQRWVADDDTLRGLLEESRKYAVQWHFDHVSREVPIREEIPCAALRDLKQQGDVARGTLVYYVDYDYRTRQTVSRERHLKFHRSNGRWFLAIDI